MAADIIYLLNLGVPIEEIAARAGRTVTAIQHELDTHYEKEKSGHHGAIKLQDYCHARM